MQSAPNDELDLLKGRELARAIAKIPPRMRDRWVDEYLSIGEPPLCSSVSRSDSDLIDCLPSGIAAIADMIVKASLGPDDVVADFGSGTGRVAILINLLCGARCVGIELDQNLVRLSRNHIKRLGLSEVTVTAGDVREVDLDIANAYYLYLPFVGRSLRIVLDRLAAIARARPIVVGSLGLDLGRESWLTTVDDSALFLTIYRSAAHGEEAPQPAVPHFLDCIAEERSNNADVG